MRSVNGEVAQLAVERRRRQVGSAERAMRWAAGHLGWAALALFVAAGVGGWVHWKRFHGGHLGPDTCAAAPARESAGRSPARAP